MTWEKVINVVFKNDFGETDANKRALDLIYLVIYCKCRININRLEISNTVYVYKMAILLASII